MVLDSLAGLAIESEQIVKIEETCVSKQMTGDQVHTEYKVCFDTASHTGAFA